MAKLIDSSMIIALLSKRDIFHERARKIFEEVQDEELYIFEHVFDEVLSVIQRKYGHTFAVEAGTTLLQSPIQILFTGMDEMLHAWDVFTTHKELSYTDAIQYSAMQFTEFDALLTFDNEFSKLGISVLN